MKYFLDGIHLPLNVEDAKIKSTLRDRLGIGLRSFRFEPCFKKIVYDPLVRKAHLEFAFSVETNSYIKDTRISFFPELEAIDFRSRSFPNGVVVVGNDFRALLFSLILAKQKISTTLMVPSAALAEKRRLSGSFIHFPNARGNEEIELILREFLGEKVGLRGDFIALTGKEHAALINAMASDFEKHGGDLCYQCNPVSVSSFLSRRKLTYMEKGMKEERRFDSIVMLDQGFCGGFYQGMKMKKTKSQYRVRLFVETKKRDADFLFNENIASLPPYFTTCVYRTKNRTPVYVAYPFNDVAIRNFSEDFGNPSLGLVYLGEKKKTTSIMTIEVSLASADELHSTVASCKRVNLPNHVPCQMVGDFVSRKESYRLGTVKSTYGAGIYLDNFHSLLPSPASDAVQNTLLKIKEEVPFLSSDAIIIGAEPVIYPGEVVVPDKVSSFVKPYWDCSNNTADLVSLGSFVFSSLKDFFGE